MEILRRAFMEILKDTEFPAAAEKSRLSVDPVGDEEVRSPFCAPLYFEQVKNLLSKNVCGSVRF